MSKPEALRLADELDGIVEDGADPDLIYEAAAELRRLHAENAAIAAALASSCDEQRHELWESGGVAGCERARVAERQRDALLEALKLARSVIGHPDDAHTQMIDATIKAVEGEKT